MSEKQWLALLSARNDAGESLWNDLIKQEVSFSHSRLSQKWTATQVDMLVSDMAQTDPGHSSSGLMALLNWLSDAEVLSQSSWINLFSQCEPGGLSLLHTLASHPEAMRLMDTCLQILPIKIRFVLLTRSCNGVDSVISTLFQYYVGDADSVSAFLNQFETSLWSKFYSRQNAKEEGVNLLLHYVAQFQNESIFSIFLQLLPISEATILLKKNYLEQSVLDLCARFQAIASFRSLTPFFTQAEWLGMYEQGQSMVRDEPWRLSVGQSVDDSVKMMFQLINFSLLLVVLKFIDEQSFINPGSQLSIIKALDELLQEPSKGRREELSRQLSSVSLSSCRSICCWLQPKVLSGKRLGDMIRNDCQLPAMQLVSMVGGRDSCV